eukprot:scaffold2331_cov126-Cylindrotheca_fusiformis.AAC.8
MPKGTMLGVEEQRNPDKKWARLRLEKYQSQAKRKTVPTIGKGAELETRFDRWMIVIHTDPNGEVSTLETPHQLLDRSEVLFTCLAFVVAT